MAAHVKQKEAVLTGIVFKLEILITASNEWEA
jgi:hypothetical protein